MNTLLIRLAAPLQSWGAASKFTKRSTMREPTKSGVVGLCACAMGMRRTDDDGIKKIAALEFGVRIDQQGTLLRDFHTARNEKQAFISERYYLADAVFLAGLSGDNELLKTIDAALKAPKFPVYLGRRSCPPSGQLSLGMRDSGLLNALCDEPWQANDWYKREHEGSIDLEIIFDAPDGIIYQDIPLSFNQQHRRYGFRYASRRNVKVDILLGGSAETRHDPISFLGGDL
ncbi:MAG: type I-E CRISPR-associated protein Cas5/CasD [Syntrophomonadaceae bacterium]|jgi:CRISPR system Cascade subunit CasD|nr:type I-E CRISPR-associated protein Cas5/CasD [Syntrophomonadaceae bacterium]